MMKKAASPNSSTEAFRFRNGSLHADGIDLTEIARLYGTPGYVYCRRAIVSRFRQFTAAFGDSRHMICYAVKANPATAIISTLARAGAGFDIVSGGELARVLEGGGTADRVVFSGVGKMDEEIEAALDAGIRSFNIESPAELQRLNQLALRRGAVAPVALRVNPDVTASTHPHISTGGSNHKFGITQQQVAGLAAQMQAMRGVALKGLAMHIGSQIEQLGPLIAAAGRLCWLVDELRETGISLDHVDLGGGLGIGPAAPAIGDYVSALTEVFRQHPDLEIVIEPGRSMVARAGVLLTRVVRIKHNEVKSFAVVDAGMNDLLRPALYQAHHDIINVETNGAPPSGTYDIVGPVCETGDTLGSWRRLAIREGSLLAIMDAGAYGAAMSSHYNSRPRCTEVMIDDNIARLTRQRETLADLGRQEKFMTTADE